MAFRNGVLVGNGDLTTGNITANGQSVVVDVALAGNVVIGLSGTFTGLAMAFEVSIDGTTWYATQMVRSNASTVESTVSGLVAPPAYVWEASVNGVNWFRARATGFTSGTAVLSIVPGLFATEPNPVVSVAGTVATTTALGTSNQLVTAATTNAQSWKSSAGSLFEISVSNPTATAIYVKVYDKASAPTVGTDVPRLTIPAAAGATVALSFGTLGKRFPIGIAIAATAAAVATDTGVAVAGVQVHGTWV